MKRPSAHDTEVAIRPARRPLFGDVNLGDRLAQRGGALIAGIVVVILAALLLQLIQASTPAFSKYGLGFLFSTRWDPVHDDYGALPFLFGTVVSSVVALLIAVPIAIGVAIFLAELAPAWLRGPVGFTIELLAAIPSVVYGLWGIFVLKPFMADYVGPVLKSTLGWLPLFSGPFDGLGMLTGALILAIMILPTIASISRDVLRAAPTTLREGALALGATRWEAIRFAVLPFVRTGLVGAVLLGLGRALGETMAITMVIGNKTDISISLFEKSSTMASQIANQYSEASDLQLAALSEIALVLFAVTLLFNIGARLLVRRGRMPGGGRS
jgi:phosphate transport system permease protein